VFDTLKTQDIINIFFEIKNKIEQHPQQKIYPYLSSKTKKVLKLEKSEINLRGESFKFIGTKAELLYIHYTDDSSVDFTKIIFKNTYIGEKMETVKNNYRTLCEELKKNFGSPQKIKNSAPDMESFFWSIIDGTILSVLNYHEYEPSIILIFSEKIF
jgi:hypothetical protein